MTDFLQSLSFGMQIAQKRHQNFIEIHSVFSELKKQIESFSNYKILIELIGDQGDYFVKFNEVPEVLYQDKSLYASLSEHADIVYSKLTDITFSTDGYPCTINVEGNIYDSFDKTSLEDNLKTLLSTPSIGQIIFDIINTKNIN